MAVQAHSCSCSVTGSRARFLFYFYIQEMEVDAFLKILQKFQEPEVLASITPKTPRDLWELCHSRVLLNVPDLKGPDEGAPLGSSG